MFGSALNLLRANTAASLLKRGASTMTLEAIDRALAGDEGWTSRSAALGYVALVAFFVLALFVFFSPTPLGPSVTAVVVISTLTLIVCALAWAWVMFQDEEDARLARLLRHHFLGEEKRLAAARALAETQPFILYLRAFDTEAQLRTRAEIEYATKLAMIRDPSNSRAMGGTGAVDVAALQQALAMKPGWDTRRALLRTMASIAPVLCFGNVFLDGQKRRELHELGVQTVTLVRTPWWDVFTEFASKAAAIVVLLEVATPSIVNELAFVNHNRLPLIVVDADPDLSEKQVQVLRASLVSESIAFFGPNDLSGIEGALRSATNRVVS